MAKQKKKNETECESVIPETKQIGRELIDTSLTFAGHKLYAEANGNSDEAVKIAFNRISQVHLLEFKRIDSRFDRVRK